MHTDDSSLLTANVPGALSGEELIPTLGRVSISPMLYKIGSGAKLKAIGVGKRDVVEIVLVSR